MEWILRAVSGAGLALGLYRAFSLFRSDINAEAFTSVLLKLLRAGNADRALRLVTAAGETALGDMVRAALLRVPSLRPEDDAAAGAALQEAYDARYKLYALRFADGRYLTALALAFQGGALVQPFLRGQPVPLELFVMGAVGLALAVWCAVKSNAILAQSAQAFARLLPALVSLANRRDEGSQDEDPAPSETPTAGPDERRPRARVTTPAPPVPAPSQMPILYFDVYRGETLERSETLAASIIKVGHDQKAHLRLVGTGVSRMHAVLEVSDGGVHVIDLGSTEGTFVRGERVNKATLAHGDSFAVGAFRVVLGIDRPPPQDD